jgi:hypothetical protein
VWKFGTGNRKCQWHAREYPEQENEVILPLLPHEPWRRAVQSTLGVGGCDNIRFGHVLVAVRQGQRRDTVATGEEQLGRCAAGQIKNIQLYL